MQTANWPKEERIDWMLFRSQLESFAFDDRVWHSTSRDPQTYVGECSNGIFSLLKKEYDTPQNRADMPKVDPAIWVKPENLAKVLLFLASDEASEITGALLPVLGRV
jgi:NAD(P)-dependent dehydrogenase (short-subunit alcohol dehydrogenase family)